MQLRFTEFLLRSVLKIHGMGSGFNSGAPCSRVFNAEASTGLCCLIVSSSSSYLCINVILEDYIDYAGGQTQEDAGTPERSSLKEEPRRQTDASSAHRGCAKCAWQACSQTAPFAKSRYDMTSISPELIVYRGRGTLPGTAEL